MSQMFPPFGYTSFIGTKSELWQNFPLICSVIEAYTNGLVVLINY